MAEKIGHKLVILFLLIHHSREMYLHVYEVSNDCGNKLSNTQFCANLSYYLANFEKYIIYQYFKVFIFTAETHYLDKLVNITNVFGLTFAGYGDKEVGMHETVMQSKSIIECVNDSMAGFMITNCEYCNFSRLTITNCGYPVSDSNTNVALFIKDSSDLYLENLSIQNSTGTAVLLSNNVNIVINNSSFAFPKPTSINDHMCHNNVIITYWDITYQYKHYLKISGSNFTFGLSNNCKYFAQNGSGLSLTYSTNIRYQFLIKILNVKFYGNTAANGANFHFALPENKGEYNMNMTNVQSLYANNILPIHQVHLMLTAVGCGFQILQQYNSKASIIKIYDSEFAHNMANADNSTSAIEVYHQNQKKALFSIYNTIIHDNTGISKIVSFQNLDADGKNNVQAYFQNVTINANTLYTNIPADAAALYLYYIETTIVSVTISNNPVTGIVAYKSILIIVHNSTFVNNSGIFGGAIALYQSNLQLWNGEVYCINNHAVQLGGAIFISQPVNIPVFCFFQCYYDINKNLAVILHFTNNTAGVAGDAIYGASTDNCLKSGCNFENLFRFSHQKGLSVLSSDPIQVCFCQSDKSPDCDSKTISYHMTPGSIFNISVVVVGFRNGLTNGVAKLTEYINTNDQITNVTHVRANTQCTTIQYEVTANNIFITSLDVYVTLETSLNPKLDTMSKLIKIYLNPCPNGFELSPDPIEGCVCRSELNNIQGMLCDSNTEQISRESNVWIGWENITLDCLVVHQPCPFDYCNPTNVTFNMNDTQLQCALNRTGLLCGQCSDGLSLMLGSNQCGECSDNYLSMIIAFGIAGIVLIVSLILLNLTVSIGTINGLIFYANIVKLYEPLFFPNGPIPVLSQFISWINLDLGINVCFFEGMNSCIKTGLQFIFPIYLWFMIVLIIVMARYSSKISHLAGTNILSVLATMILLSYTKLIRTVIFALYLTNINCIDDDGETVQTTVWFVDPNIVYLNECHLPLFIISLTVLVILIAPYTCYLILIPVTEKWCQCYQKLTLSAKPFFDAYGGPYQDRSRFWTGFLLLIRIILALVVSLDSTISIDVLVSVLIIVLCMYFMLKGIYRSKSLMLLDVFFISNLLLLAQYNTKRNNTESHQTKGKIATIVSVTLSFSVFLCIVVYHIWKRQFINAVNPTSEVNVNTEVNIALHPPTRSPSPIIMSNVAVDTLSDEEEREPLIYYSD